MDRAAWRAQSMGLQRVRQDDWVINTLKNIYNIIVNNPSLCFPKPLLVSSNIWTGLGQKRLGFKSKSSDLVILVKVIKFSELQFSHWKTSKSELKVAQSCLTLCNLMDCSPWNSPGQNTGVGSLSLLQGIFPTQGSNPGLLHCRWILYQRKNKADT